MDIQTAKSNNRQLQKNLRQKWISRKTGVFNRQANLELFQLEDRLRRRSLEVYNHLTDALCTGYVVESHIETVVFIIT